MANRTTMNMPQQRSKLPPETLKSRLPMLFTARVLLKPAAHIIMAAMMITLESANFARAVLGLTQPVMTSRATTSMAMPPKSYLVNASSNSINSHMPMVIAICVVIFISSLSLLSDSQRTGACSVAAGPARRPSDGVRYLGCPGTLFDTQMVAHFFLFTNSQNLSFIQKGKKRRKMEEGHGQIDHGPAS